MRQPLRHYALAGLLLALISYSCKKDRIAPVPPPGGLTITNISDTSATASWTAVPNATAYYIYVAPDAGFKSSVTGSPFTVKQTTFNMAGLTPYQRYFVKVVAVINTVKSNPGTTDFTTLDADNLIFVSSDDYSDYVTNNYTWHNFNLYAIHARDGSIAWTITGSAGNQIVKDSIIYVMKSDGYLYALDMTGVVKWKFGLALSSPIFSTIPLIKNGVLYIGDIEGRLWAVNTTDGSLKWYSSPIIYPSNSIDASPIINDSATTLYITSDDGMVHSYDAATGTMKWSSLNTGNPIQSRPALYNNTVYAGCFSRMYAFDAQTGAYKWNSTDPHTTLNSSMAISNNKALVGGDDGYFYSVNLADGSLNWKKPLPLPGGITSSPIVTGGVIYVGSVGRVYALDETTGAVNWENDTVGDSSAVYSGPVVTDNYLYTGSVLGNFYQLDKKTGKILWTIHPLAASWHSSPCVVKYSGKVFYPGVSGMTQ